MFVVSSFLLRLSELREEAGGSKMGLPYLYLINFLGGPLSPD